ncbi:MAG: hypothetical protein IKG04_01425 [Exiguobacterium sp.]|nr:hypothetical protein [Exiguobacterium sp.]
MTTDQIYSLVNSAAEQSIGSTGVAAIDTSSLVSLGNTILSSSTNTEAFLNTLAQRIGRTILRYRDYRNKLRDMVVNDFEYGAILQKIKVVMPEAVADPAYSLTDGQSVDPWVVAKPEVDQKLFVKRTPYMFHITIQEHTLREAFLSAEAMGGFIATVFGEVRNAIELAMENLGRLTIATGVAEASAREIKLVTDYHDETGETLTALTALHDAAFLAYAVRRMNSARDFMEDMSSMYNDGTLVTFTPKEDLRVRINSTFHRALETVVQYAAFHDELVENEGVYTLMNFWQGSSDSAMIDITRPSDGQRVTLDNVVCVMHDRDALGMYQIDERVATTRVNERGLYYNTFYHERQLWFVDRSENLVFFTLN